MSVQRPAVGVSEAVTLVFIFIAANIFLPHMVFIFDESMNAAWMVPVLNTVFAIPVVLLLAAVLEKRPGCDLVQIGEELAGPYINTLFALFYLAVFVISAGFTLRSVSERMVAGFLTDTPISLVTLFFLAGTVTVAYLCLEAVARTARFLVGVLVVSTLLLVVLTAPFWQMHVFYPLWGAGPREVFAATAKNMGNFIQILLLGVIAPFLPVGEAGRVGVRGVAIAGFFMSLLVLVPLLIFTYPAVTELALPTLEMARIINIERFGQRMEVLFLPVWVFGNMIFISAALYAGAAVLARLCKLGDYRPFVLSVTVFSTVVAFIPQNASQVAYWTHRYMVMYSFYVLLIILLALLLASRLKRGGGGQNEKGV